MPFYVDKINCIQKKLIQRKRTKLLVQIDNFQFNKGMPNKIIGLRRMLARTMLECGESA